MLNYKGQVESWGHISTLHDFFTVDFEAVGVYTKNIYDKEG